MTNPYIIILALFALGGIGTMIYGAVNIKNARRHAIWPTTEGKIEDHTESTNSPDMQAYITFSHELDGKTFQKRMVLSSYVAGRLENKFTRGTKVNLQYDPANPENMIFATNESHSEWLTIAAGAGATIFGVFAIVSNI